MRETIFFSRKPTRNWIKSCSCIHIKHLLWFWTPNNNETSSGTVFQTSSGGTPVHTQVIRSYMLCEILTFKDWIWLQKLFFDLINLCPFSTHSSYIWHDKFAGLCGGEPNKAVISIGKKATSLFHRLNLRHIFSRSDRYCEHIHFSFLLHCCTIWKCRRSLPCHETHAITSAILLI